MGIATSAVLARVPGAADAGTVPEIVNVAVPPDANVTSSATLPVPEAFVQLEPAEAAHVQVPPTITPGRLSVTSAFEIVEGPALVTTIE
jgi:hypothetical protein